MDSLQAKFSQERMMMKDKESGHEDVWDQTHHYLPHDQTYPQGQSAQIHHQNHQEEEYQEGQKVD